MTKKHNVSASCLCGGVSVTVKNMDMAVGACHCATCRKWTGGPLLAVDCGTDVTVSDHTLVTEYESSTWASRGFCSGCGTHLYYKLKHNGQHIMPAGLFAEEQDFDFDHQIFIESKPDYYDFANKTKNMTGEEVFAQAQTDD